MRAFATLSLAAILLAPAAAQAASAPAGPDALPSLAAGVVGSGNQLALQLKAADGAPARTLKVGDEFQDGWVLTGLDASAATLTKAGTSRTVGLNPAGAVDAPPPAVGGATVTVVSPAQTRVIQAQQGVLDAQAAAAQAAAALAAATPDTLAAAQQAVRTAQIRTQNAQLSVQNALIAAAAQ